jgi:Tat protein translocase TatB subunit
MFGLGMGEIVLIAVVALLVLGPERLPGAAKAIGKGIRDLRSQTKDLTQTIENDTQIGEAVREIRGALRGDPETLYKRATGEDFRKTATPPPPPANTGDAKDSDSGSDSKDESANSVEPEELIKPAIGATERQSLESDTEESSTSSDENSSKSEGGASNKSNG